MHIILIIHSTGIVDLPAIMTTLSPFDIQDIEDIMPSIFRRYSLLPQSRLIGQPSLVNEFFKLWITKHQNPTWEALVDLLGAFGIPSVAEKIRNIIPPIHPPAPEHAALKKND